MEQRDVVLSRSGLLGNYTISDGVAAAGNATNRYFAVDRILYNE